MAAEVGSAPVNGYGAAAYGSAPSVSAPSTTSTATSQTSDISKEQVAWYFVESYYTTMSQTPDKLHLFFNKKSQLVSGVEEEKSSVASGQRAIKERLAELDFQDCKVRVTNVDSQGSGDTIVIQVIGEMSNKSQPHRKFVQTFILASQTNGYFVLNDIFRYIKDDVDEEEQEQNEEVIAAEQQESSQLDEPLDKEEDVKAVEQKLEEVAKTEEAPAAAVNGTPVPEEADVAEAEEAPAAAVSAPDTAKTEEVTAEIAQEDIAEPEKPQDPLPTPKNEAATPAAAPAAASTPSAPPKPAVPRSWAQLAAGNQANKAAAAPAAARQAPAPSQPKAAAAPAATQAPPSAPAAVREASPDSTKEGSTGGWQTAGADHARKQSKPVNAGQGDGKVRAFVKNVTEDVDADALKQVLAKYGEIVYFDVARQKRAAFVEYKTTAAFTAAVNASPLRVGNEDVYVEERRVGAPGGPRGGARGGRGDFGGRGGAPRGNYGPRGGRGGSGNVTPRGGRGGAQA